MPEQIQILEGNIASIIVFNAIAAAVGKDDPNLLEKFGIPLPSKDNLNPTATVEMKVNGVEVPVEETLRYFWLRFDEYVKAEAKDLLEEVVKGAGLEKIRAALERAEWDITQSVEEFLKNREKK